MHVLNVVAFIDPVNGGGMVERSIQMSRFLARAGVRCTILTTDLGLKREQVQSLTGVEVVALPCLNARFYLPRFSLRALRKLVRSADVVHLMGHWTFLNALVYRISRSFRVPYVICSAGSLPAAGRSRLLKAIYNRVIGKRIIREAEGHIAVTADELPDFHAYGVAPERITIIPNGINPEDFTAQDNGKFREKFGLDSSPIILYMGRLNHIKGPDLLVQAFGSVKDRLPSYQLVLVGPDEGMLPRLKEIVKRFDMSSRVHFLGYMGGADKSQAYRAAELLVVPSRQEAMSIVVLEAGITGTPVLLTDKCGFHEVADNNSGMIVPATVEGLREGLIGMLGDPGALTCMGKNIEKFINERYTWDIIVKRYAELYNKILGSSRR